jgi:hypothetical protein
MRSYSWEVYHTERHYSVKHCSYMTIRSLQASVQYIHVLSNTE